MAEQECDLTGHTNEETEQNSADLSGISEEVLGLHVPVELNSLKVISPLGIFLQ